jgi:tRNA(Ile)-lysidine synthase
VSGGADSVALLLLLLELQKELGIALSVVHFNHKLRGRAADADEKFVAKLAEKHGLTLYVARGDVARRAQRQKRNLEDAARRSRYEFFAELMNAGKLDKIAVAHTADDQAETVLAHILRGTGLAGLAGIYPTADFVVRPLLGTRRAELRAYLRSRKQVWREDATNLDLTKTRARIRKKLLPLLEKQFQPAVVDHLCTLAALARDDEALLNTIIGEAYRKSVQRTGAGLRIATSMLLHFGEEKRTNAKGPESTDEQKRHADALRAMSARLVRRVVQRIKIREGQLSSFHVNAVLDLAKYGGNGTSLELPGRVDVRRENDSLIFCVRQESRGVRGAPSKAFEYEIDGIDQSYEISVRELSCVFRFTVIDWPSKRGDTKSIESVLDRDALQFPLLLRNWRPGDKLHPFGHQGTQKLKRLLNKQHVSRWERDGWPVLTSGGRLAWAKGLPVASEFAVREGTRRGLVITEEPVLSVVEHLVPPRTLTG